MNIENNKNSVPILDSSNMPSIQEYIDTIKTSSLPLISLDHYSFMKVLQEKFNKFMCD